MYKGFRFRCAVGKFPWLNQTIFLLFVDMTANAVDYVYHVYLGRTLVPGEFAVFQTLNSALLIVITATGVMQPVVARYVAEYEGLMQEQKGALSGDSVALCREYLGWSAVFGGILSVGVWGGSDWLAKVLNLPQFAIQLGAGVVFLVLLRPVIAGMLQGAQQFVLFGTVRLAYALGRFAVAGILLYWGYGLWGAVASLPLGQLFAVGGGLIFIIRGACVSRSMRNKKEQGVLTGMRLAGWAFFAYLAHTALLNIDMLWVNRVFPPDEAGIYAVAVLLRRILLLLPGVAVVVLYPRVVSAVAQRRLPDREILTVVWIVSIMMAIFVAGYFTAGGSIARLAFGEVYRAAGSLLGWMGVGVWGLALGTIWLNVFLATRPGLFVGLLVGIALLQGVGLVLGDGTLIGVVGVFSLTGWGLAMGGGVLYGFWLRPKLAFQNKETG